MNRRWGGVVLCGVLAGLMGCGKRIPSEVIQPGEMEDLLYDYHLASTLSNSLPYQENYKKEAYLAYVFQKHGVTQAEFDSSMVWYTRNRVELAELYKRLDERFQRDEERMKAQVAQRDNQIDVSVSGDTVDIWQDRTLYWLSASTLTNRVTFDLKADTTFRPKDAFSLTADFHFVPQACPVKSAQAVMGLRLLYENDSIDGCTRMVTASGAQQLSLRLDSAWQLKSVSGFIYYSQPDDVLERGSVLVNDIHLMRYHYSEKTTEAEAPLAVDSLVAEPI